MGLSVATRDGESGISPVTKKAGRLATARRALLSLGLDYLTNTEIVTLTVCPPGP